MDAPNIFISAAEPSGDLHGASLICAVRSLSPGVKFVGVAGPRMVAEGCKPIFDMTAHAAMLFGALRSARRAADMLTAAFRRLQVERFDAAVVIDSPTLHLPLAALAKDAGVPVMYYVAPQLWAWGAGRIRKIRRRVDRLAVILPFEESYFQDRGVPAVFVGHPLADLLARSPIESGQVEQIRQDGQPFIALLPGSRLQVVQQVLPGQLEVGEAIRTAFPHAAIGVSVSGPQVAAAVDSHVRTSRAQVQTVHGPPGALIEAADLVLVASGTATLEVAFRRRAMIVMYNASRFLHGPAVRWLVRTPHLCLPNILAGREVVPEFMPYYISTRPIADRAIELLSDLSQRAAMIAALDEVTMPLRVPGASHRAALVLFELIRSRTHP